MAIYPYGNQPQQYPPQAASPFDMLFKNALAVKAQPQRATLGQLPPPPAAMPDDVDMASLLKFLQVASGLPRRVPGGGLGPIRPQPYGNPAAMPDDTIRPDMPYRGFTPDAAMRQTPPLPPEVHPESVPRMGAPVPFGAGLPRTQYNEYQMGTPKAPFGKPTRVKMLGTDLTADVDYTTPEGFIREEDWERGRRKLYGIGDRAERLALAKEPTQQAIGDMVPPELRNRWQAQKAAIAAQSRLGMGALDRAADVADGAALAGDSGGAPPPVGSEELDGSVVQKTHHLWGRPTQVGTVPIPPNIQVGKKPFEYTDAEQRAAAMEEARSRKTGVPVTRDIEGNWISGTQQMPFAYNSAAGRLMDATDEYAGGLKKRPITAREVAAHNRAALTDPTLATIPIRGYTDEAGRLEAMQQRKEAEKMRRGHAAARDKKKEASRQRVFEDAKLREIARTNPAAASAIRVFNQIGDKTGGAMSSAQKFFALSGLVGKDVAGRLMTLDAQQAEADRRFNLDERRVATEEKQAGLAANQQALQNYRAAKDSWDTKNTTYSQEAAAQYQRHYEALSDDMKKRANWVTEAEWKKNYIAKTYPSLGPPPDPYEFGVKGSGRVAPGTRDTEADTPGVPTKDIPEVKAAAATAVDKQSQAKGSNAGPIGSLSGMEDRRATWRSENDRAAASAAKPRSNSVRPPGSLNTQTSVKTARDIKPISGDYVNTVGTGLPDPSQQKRLSDMAAKYGTGYRPRGDMRRTVSTFMSNNTLAGPTATLTGGMIKMGSNMRQNAKALTGNLLKAIDDGDIPYDNPDAREAIRAVLLDKMDPEFVEYLTGRIKDTEGAKFGPGWSDLWVKILNGEEIPLGHDAVRQAKKAGLKADTYEGSYERHRNKAGRVIEENMPWLSELLGGSGGESKSRRYSSGDPDRGFGRHVTPSFRPM